MKNSNELARYPLSAHIHGLMELLSDKHLYGLFRQQIKNANRRHIRWNLSFEEWVDIWLESGRLQDRGPKPEQYCLSRYNDVGAYEVGNVEVKTNRENCRENGLNRPRSLVMRVAKQMRKPRGCIVYGEYFHSLNAAAKKYRTSHNTVSNRIASNSVSFKEWRAA